MRVRYTQDHGGRKAGTTHDLPDEQARAAVDGGYAEEANTQAAATDKDGNEGMRLRFRHAVTVDGKDYGANTVGFVPVTDEAWRAVNDGHADLDPPPGERLANGVQPFPPEWVSRDETTEAAAPAVPVVRTVPAQAADVNDPAKGKNRTAATTRATPDTVGKNPHSRKKG